MPKVKTNRVKYPEGWELIEPTLRDLQAKMREAENDTHDGKRKCETLWPIFKIAHQKSRYIFDLYHRRKEISKELYEFCLDQGYADRNLIAKWKKPGYERLCCLRCMQPRDHNFATTCVCRVPKHLREEKSCPDGVSVDQFRLETAEKETVAVSTWFKVISRIKGSSVNDSFVKPESSRQKLINALAIPRSEGQEMEGRRLSDFYRNTSEELILRSYMESPVAMPLPTMEILGFKNLSQNFRTDSEELFKSWLTNGEASSHTNCYNSSSIAHRTRTRMISTEIASLPGQQHVGILQKKRSNDCLYPPINTMPDEISGDNNQSSIRHGVEPGIQASELYLAKAWFHSSQPMTRSRSSELRRRYVAMQKAQMPAGLEVMQTASGNSNLANQDFAFSNGFNDPSICEVSNQLATFISPSNSSSSTFNTPQMSEMDKVSSVVSMLKGTLERKKLSNQIKKQSVDDDRSNGRFSVQEVIVNTGFDQGERDQLHGMAAGTFPEVSTIQVNGHRITQKVEGSLDLQMEGFVNITNPNPVSRTSQERSQSESSAAAPVVSSGFDAWDGPSNSGQTLSICESSIKRAESSRSKDVRERIIGNLKDDQKSGKRLERYGSVTSAVSVDKEDATKKRRVERSRKMAEAKGRNSTPVIPSDMQSVLKRCENLEKEVRSLKLNLSFMNRKDSEQTKQIEELQKQNEDLMDEKERLVEEIERVLSETGNV
ncbi:hypothetical protein FF1_037359 [Malus domestica]